jgi:hypothetical protein
MKTTHHEDDRVPFDDALRRLLKAGHVKQERSKKRKRKEDQEKKKEPPK